MWLIGGEGVVGFGVSLIGVLLVDWATLGVEGREGSSSTLSLSGAKGKANLAIDQPPFMWWKLRFHQLQHSQSLELFLSFYWKHCRPYWRKSRQEKFLHHFVCQIFPHFLFLSRWSKCYQIFWNTSHLVFFLSTARMEFSLFLVWNTLYSQYDMQCSHLHPHKFLATSLLCIIALAIS